jgi:large subunit ribosomal protein L27
MATKKAAGAAKNLRDSQPKYLGVKIHDGERANVGNVIVRQRGTRVVPGRNTKLGKDHTIYAMKAGLVRFKTVRKTKFNGDVLTKKVASVVE